MIDTMIRQLFVGAALILVAAGCGVTDGPADRDKWVNRSVSADVVTARAQAGRDADALFARLPIAAATAASSDSCVVGERDAWQSDEFQFACTRTEIRYVPVDGDLLPLLIKIDAAARAEGAAALPDAPIENVRYYFAHAGRDADGLQLPKPRLAYQDHRGTLAVNWRDPAFAVSTAAPTEHPMTWPQVYRTQTAATDLPGLVAAHDNVLELYVSTTYFKIPWSG